MPERPRACSTAARLPQRQRRQMRDGVGEAAVLEQLPDFCAVASIAIEFVDFDFHRAHRVQRRRAIRQNHRLRALDVELQQIDRAVVQIVAQPDGRKSSVGPAGRTVVEHTPPESAPSRRNASRL